MRPIKREYTQEPHCCINDGDDPRLSMELIDGGGGEYLVLHAVQWSLDSDAEVDALAAEIKAMLAQAKGSR